jgi:hypothetical protein
MEKKYCNNFFVNVREAFLLAGMTNKCYFLKIMLGNRHNRAVAFSSTPV